MNDVIVFGELTNITIASKKGFTIKTLPKSPLFGQSLRQNLIAKLGCRSIYRLNVKCFRFFSEGITNSLPKIIPKKVHVN